MRGSTDSAAGIEATTIYRAARAERPLTVAPPEESVQEPIFKVGVAEYAVTVGGEYQYLRSSGFGSCIGVVLHDESTSVTALLHFMLPSTEKFTDPDPNPAKFGDTGIESMLDSFTEVGGTIATTEAKLAGGARMMSFESDSNPIGTRNLERARAELKSYGIEVTGTDTGGEIGRTVTVDTRTGDVSIQRSDGKDITI